MAKRTKRLIEELQEDDSIRINKYLSDAGVCSRREADRFIQSSKVTVDGVTATIGTKVSKGQKVIFCGKLIKIDEQLALIAFHKPRGIVCTTDTREKNNIIDFIQYGKRIYPIGRLDKDSEGLILLTNDGNIVNKILRAGNNHEKEYIVTLNKQITSEFLKGMAAGVPILDTVTRPCTIKALDKFSFQIILTQGLNRQIRRMCEHFDYKVLTLKRIRIMNIKLGHLQLGGYRNVTEKEIEGLKELMNNSSNTPYQPLEEYKQENEKNSSEAKHEVSSRGKSTHKDSTYKGSTQKDSAHKKYKTSSYKTPTHRPKKDFQHKGKRIEENSTTPLSKVETEKDSNKKSYTRKESDKFKKSEVKTSSYKKSSYTKGGSSPRRGSDFDKMEMPPNMIDSNSPKRSSSNSSRRGSSAYGNTGQFQSRISKTKNKKYF